MQQAFNYEEVGSLQVRTDSASLPGILERILSKMGCSKEQIDISLAQSYYLSVDNIPHIQIYRPL